MPDIMEFREVVKTFSDVKALNGVSFRIPQNSIFGLLGPNGAGKTTLIRIITKIFAADSGEIIFDGINIKAQQSANIGYMPEEKGMYKKMKVGEQLIYLSALKGIPKKIAKERIEYWFNKLEVKDWWNKKVQDLSKGMQQKAQFIATVLHQPKLLILDEPFSGLDPVNAEMIKNEIYELHEQGVTIIFSTHRMEQVEEICKNIVLINKGNVVISGEVRDIKQQFKQHKFNVGFSGNQQIESNELFQITAQYDHSITIQLNNTASHNHILSYFIDRQIEVSSFNEILPTLNDIFISLVKEDNREQNVADH
jgi:ABC-2 type transport system ATP-binding protein